MSLLAKAVRSISYQDVWGKALDMNDSGEWSSSRTSAGVVVTQDTAMRLVAVYACVRLLAESVAHLPIDTFTRGADGTRTPVAEPQWLLTPNFEITRFEFFERMMAGLLLDGNSYTYINRNSSGDIVEMIPLNPARVKVARADGRLVYSVTDDRGVVRPVTDWKAMLHVRGFSTGGLCGVSPITHARQAIGLGLAAEKFQGDWLGSGDAPASILTTDKDMTREQAKQNQVEWVASRGGKRRPAFLSGGLKWESVTISPDDAQAMSTERWSVEQIARLYRVPPHMIGELSRSTFSNIEHQGIDFVTHSLTPWLVRIEQAMRWLLPPGVDLKFNVSALLRGDTTSRYNAYVQARNAGWLNVDEIRAKEDLAPVPDGKGAEYIQPLNMGPLGSVPAPTGGQP